MITLVVSNDRDKAYSKMDEIAKEVSVFDVEIYARDDSNYCMKLKNNDSYIVLINLDYIQTRGKRCDKLYIDNSMDYEYINKVVLPVSKFDMDSEIFYF